MFFFLLSFLLISSISSFISLLHLAHVLAPWGSWCCPQPCSAQLYAWPPACRTSSACCQCPWLACTPLVRRPCRRRQWRHAGGGSGGVRWRGRRSKRARAPSGAAAVQAAAAVARGGRASAARQRSKRARVPSGAVAAGFKSAAARPYRAIGCRPIFFFMWMFREMSLEL